METEKERMERRGDRLKLGEVQRGHLALAAAARLGAHPGPVTYREELDATPRMAWEIHQDGKYIGSIIEIGPDGIVPAEEAP